MTTLITPSFDLSGEWNISWGHGGAAAELVEHGTITFTRNGPDTFSAPREDMGELEARVFTISRPLGAAYNPGELTAISITQTGNNYIALWCGYPVVTQTPPEAEHTGRVQGWWCDGAMGNGPFELRRKP